MTFVRGLGSEPDAAGIDSVELDAFYNRPQRQGWGETLFTGATAILFLVLIAAAATGAFLYTQS